MQLLRHLQAVELHVAVERELDLVRVQDVEHRHLVPLEPQVLQALQERRPRRRSSRR